MRTVTSRRTAERTRSGSSLIELITALALFGIVGAAMVRALDRQARFHDGIVRLLEARAQLSASQDAMALELRAASTADADVESVTDTALVYRALIGTAVACGVAANVIDLVPAVLASGQALASFASSPQSGDTAWLFDEGALPASTDDQWLPLYISNAARITGACTGTPFIDSVADAGSPGWRLTVTPPTPPPATIGSGAAVRITRRSRFALYRASSGETALGWAEWNAVSGAWNVIQPVTTGFVAYSSARPGAGGVAVQASDSTGAVLSPGTPAPRATRLRVSVRALTRGAVRMDGMSRGQHVDSLTTIIALRNRQ